MKKHTKIYFDYFNIEHDPSTGWHACFSEISGFLADDIHHIDCKGMGGSKTKDTIDNLMALTREEHEQYGDKKQHIEYLKQVHSDFIKRFAKGKFK